MVHPIGETTSKRVTERQRDRMAERERKYVKDWMRAGEIKAGPLRHSCTNEWAGSRWEPLLHRQPERGSTSCLWCPRWWPPQRPRLASPRLPLPSPGHSTQAGASLLGPNMRKKRLFPPHWFSVLWMINRCRCSAVLWTPAPLFRVFTGKLWHLRAPTHTYIFIFCFVLDFCLVQFSFVIVLKKKSNCAEYFAYCVLASRYKSSGHFFFRCFILTGVHIFDGLFWVQLFGELRLGLYTSQQY